MKYIKTEKINISDLIMDWNIYPRHEESSVKVTEYFNALQAGAVFPPIRVDNETQKVVDGFHRLRVHKRAKLDEIEAEFYSFESEAEMVFWGIRWNVQHGLRLSRYDQSRCLNIGRIYGLDDGEIAEALCLTIDKITKLEADRVRLHADTKMPIEVKKIVADITTDTVTQKQINAQKKFNAMGAEYHIKRAYDTLKHGFLVVNELNIDLVERLSEECGNWLSVNRLKQVN